MRNTISLTTFLNEAIFLRSKLRHLVTNLQHNDETNEYLYKQKKIIKEYNQKDWRNFSRLPEKPQDSYKIVYLTIKKKKHSDAENLILPAVEIAVGKMISVAAVKQIKTIPLPADTISHKIQDVQDWSKERKLWSL